MPALLKTGKTVGIDLGTTRSTLAHMDEHGKAVVVPNAELDLVTPSVVLIESDDTVLVGSDAKNQSVAAGDRVVRESKREIGRTDLTWSVGGTEYNAEMIGAMVLKKLKQDAENQDNILVDVREGEEEDLQFCREVGTGLIDNIPPLPKGAPVEATLVFTVEGLIEVHARELTHGRELHMTLERPKEMEAGQLKKAENRMSKMTVS